jgi:hypothetical protein
MAKERQFIHERFVPELMARVDAELIGPDEHLKVLRNMVDRVQQEIVPLAWKINLPLDPNDVDLWVPLPLDVKVEVKEEPVLIMDEYLRMFNFLRYIYG